MESTTLEYNIERKCDLMQIGGWLDYKSYNTCFYLCINNEILL